MLKLSKLTWQPPEGGQIIKGMDLAIPDGKLVVLTGPNGGGKTTLAKLIAGLETPTSIVAQLSRQKSKIFIMN